MRIAIFAIMFALAMPDLAHAGAWTLPEDHAQVLVGATYSRAVQGFDAHGIADAPIRYEKTLVQLDAEYGWNDWLTLILEPEYAHARSAAANRIPQHANDAAVAGGVRLRLFRDAGIASVQLTAKTAGAFDMSVSAFGAPGRQLELRVLYGTNFTLFGRRGFFDAEIAERWIAGARADEVPIDLTVGLGVCDDTMLMVQSFNVLAQGNSRPPYVYYRLHKLSLSLVNRIGPGLRLETSGFFTVAGQNALQELGAGLRIWIDF